MQKILNTMLATSLLIALASCGSRSKDEKTQLGDLKVKLEKLKKDKAGLDEQIRQTEDQIAKADPNAVKQSKLVSVDTLQSQDFTHFIELQGKVDAENVTYVSPRGQGGQIRAIYVKQGDQVRKGQTILTLDDALARQTVVTAQQGLSGLKAQLSLAQSIYQRQENLWKQNIGTEVQVLNAKTNVDALQSQLNAAEANVKLAQEQLSQSNVIAEISGVVDQLNVKVGEFFSPASAANPSSGIRLVNTGDLKIIVQVPENYLGSVQVGSLLQVTIPEANNKIITSKVTVVGKLIDPNNRSFSVEGKLPQDKALHPNQIAVAEIRDYTASNAIAIPVNVVQTDEKGKYVFVMEQEAGKNVARKKTVTTGETYKGLMEIRSGLNAGDKIITEGYQTLYEGQTLSTGI